MKRIYIKTTESCQLHCDHCYIGDNRKFTIFFDEFNTINWVTKYIEKFNIDPKDVLFSFHGGEPFLCPLDKMITFVNAFSSSSFDATSNLCFKLTPDIIKFIKNSFRYNENGFDHFIKTSWDYKIRFHEDDLMFLWENNVLKLLSEKIEVKVIICLTNLLIENVIPKELIFYFRRLGVNYIDFERLTYNTTYDKSLIPDYIKQDEWLQKFYEENKSIRVGLFESLELASQGIFEGCRDRHCMMDVLTINPNGTIGGCPNSAIVHPFTDIYSNVNILLSNCKHCDLIQIESRKDPRCYSCELYTTCNGDCHQLSWQGDVCPAPKGLIRRINQCHGKKNEN
jgi:radical SAM protein with 4Fe4S-binding SPASM domain